MAAEGTSAVVLVCMPWSAVARPSLALGILQAVLDRRGVPTTTRSFHLAFAEHVIGATAHDARPITLDDLTAIGEETAGRGYGDWVFAVEPYRTPVPEADAEYL